MDIRLVRKELQVQFSNLNSAEYDNASIAASDFYEFITTTKTTAAIIAGLPKDKVDVDAWLQGFQASREFSLPRNIQERVVLLLAVLEKYKEDPTQIAYLLHAGSTNITDHIRKYVDNMVKPIYQYLDGELHKKELEAEPLSHTSITANHSIIINGNNYGSISQTNNNTVRLLSELSDVLQKSDSLTSDQKLEAVNNIDTIKSQVLSPKPNAQIVKLAWQTVTAMCTIAGATDFVTQIAHLIPHLV